MPLVDISHVEKVQVFLVGRAKFILDMLTFEV